MQKQGLFKTFNTVHTKKYFMHKIWIIIQREYTSRVKNKRFLMVTFLVPLLMVGLIVGSAYFSFKGTEERKIAVVDPNGFTLLTITSAIRLVFSSITPRSTMVP